MFLDELTRLVPQLVARVDRLEARQAASTAAEQPAPPAALADVAELLRLSDERLTGLEHRHGTGVYLDRGALHACLERLTLAAGAPEAPALLARVAALEEEVRALRPGRVPGNAGTAVDGAHSDAVMGAAIGENADENTDGAPDDWTGRDSDGQSLAAMTAPPPEPASGTGCEQPEAPPEPPCAPASAVDVLAPGDGEGPEGEGTCEVQEGIGAVDSPQYAREGISAKYARARPDVAEQYARAREAVDGAELPPGAVADKQSAPDAAAPRKRRDNRTAEQRRVYQREYGRQRRAAARGAVDAAPIAKCDEVPGEGV
jgi:hypothetical protein